MTATTSAHLTCLCGAVTAPGALLRDTDIPIAKEVPDMCHCNSCRYTTGALSATFPRLKSSPGQETLARTTAYQSSNAITRHFCSTCGCHCFVHIKELDSWDCLGGIVEPSAESREKGISWPKDTVKVTEHGFVADTVDGGLTPFLLNLNGRIIPTWSADTSKTGEFDLPHEKILDMVRTSASNIPKPKENSYLSAKCHCGGVSFLIKRASNNSDPNTSSPNVSSDPTKYLTNMCACRSCRLSTGVALMPFAFVLTRNIFNANFRPNSASQGPDETLIPVTFGEPSDNPEANPGLTLKNHWSSPGVCRSFCGNCGATVTYWTSDRPHQLDVAVGILRADEGSMARNWLEWEWGQCSHDEECLDNELCEAWLGCSKVMEGTSG